MNSTQESWVGDDVDLPAIAAKLWRQRGWIAASITVCTLIAVAIAFFSTPLYLAEAVLVPASSDRGALNGSLNAARSPLGGLASIAGINVGGDMETEEALAVLRSRQFTEAFIQGRQLMPVLFADKWDAAQRQWKSGTKQPTAAQAFRYFDRRIRSIVQDKKTGLVTLQIEWRDREQAAQWANELVQNLNAEMRAREIAKTDASVGYLEQELRGTTAVATRDAISRLIESQIKQRMLANVTQEYSFRIVDRALAPDSGDTVKPRKEILLVAGVMVGLALGVIGVLLAGMFASRPGRQL